MARLYSARLLLPLVGTLVSLLSLTDAWLTKSPRPCRHIGRLHGRSVSSLLEWAKSVGIQQSPVLKLAQESLSGYGWQVVDSLAPNQVLLQVPTAVALTVVAPGQGPNDSRVVRQAIDRSAFRDLPWFVQFSAYFYVLKKNTVDEDATMNRKPWLDSLPTALDTPLHWTDQEVDQLQYEFMTKAVQKQKQVWQKYHSNLLNNGFPDLSWDDFVWGCEMARSRAFSGAYTGGAFNPRIYVFTLLLVAIYVGLGIGSIDQAANGAGVVFCATVLKDFVLPKLFKRKQYVICPLIDMANHRSVGYTGEVSFEYFDNAYSLASNAAAAALAEGNALCISYGARSNDQWLQYYGFCESMPPNPNDVYIMPPLRDWPLQEMEQAAKRTVAPGRLQALERAGLLGYTPANNADASDDTQPVLFDENAANADGGVVLASAIGLDPAVWQALRALFCTEAEWQAAGQAVGSFAESAPSAATQAAVRAAAKAALQWELERKETTLEQDQALEQRMSKFKAVDASTAERLALQFRIEKKKLLQECLRSIV